MTQISGDQWAKHMLYGTSRLLQSSGTTRHVDELRKQFQGAFKWLEVNRAILYAEDTILSREEWRNHYGCLSSSSWDPLDTVFELSVQISSFSKL